jgi:alginate O-acetyltransferase complex protein AlgI
LAAVMGGWVLFRCDTLAHAAGYYRALAGLSAADPRWHPLAEYVNPLLVVTLATAVAFSMPLAARVTAWRERAIALRPLRAVAIAGDSAWIGAVFVAASAMLAAGTYNPFIYFRF